MLPCCVDRLDTLCQLPMLEASNSTAIVLAQILQ